MSERIRRFEALYSEHYRAIYAYVYRRLALRSSEVSDVVAEVFVVAWRRLDDVPVGDAQRLWLYGVASRCVLTSQRGARRRFGLIERLVEEARVERFATDSDPDAVDVRAALERLRVQDREVLRLVMWEELSHAEAAAVLECSVNAVAQRLSTARRRLADQLNLTTENLTVRK